MEPLLMYSVTYLWRGSPAGQASQWIQSWTRQVEPLLMYNLPVARIPCWSSKPMDPGLWPGKWSHCWCMNYLWPGSPAGQVSQWIQSWTRQVEPLLMYYLPVARIPCWLKQANGSRAKPGLRSHCWCVTYLWPGFSNGQASQWIQSWTRQVEPLLMNELHTCGQDPLLVK